MGNFFRNIHPLLRRGKRKDEYDDTNFSVLNALNYELTQAEQETIASKIQSSLETATGEYLDTWGDWFGVYRKDGWDDDYYRGRIIRYLLLKRSTIPAIIDALVDFLDDNDAHVEIYEPWKNIFYTNKSKLNGEDHMMGYYYRFAIIDISIDRPFPPEIIDVIMAFKPAGVLFYLRLDTSLNANATPVESPWAFVDVSNKTDLEFLNGLTYDIRGNMNLTDQTEQVVDNDLFHTNRSHLNGADVLAGSFTHGRGYLHLASVITIEDYLPKLTDSMSEVKLALGEANPDFYIQTKDIDGCSASIQIPSKKRYQAWSWNASGTDRFTNVYPNENLLEGDTISEWVTPPYSANPEIGYGVYKTGLEKFMKNYVGRKVTFSFEAMTASVGSWAMYTNTTNPKYLYPRQNLVSKSTGWEKYVLTVDITETTGAGATEIQVYGNRNGNFVTLRNFKIEDGEKATMYTTNPSFNLVDSAPTYKGYSSTDTSDPKQYLWVPIKNKVNLAETSMYSVFDVNAFIDNNYAVEFARLKKELGEEEAFNTLFNEFTISTSLKALVPPSDPLNTQVEIYDFKFKKWQILTKFKLDLKDSVMNLEMNRVTDYLNEHDLLFVRYVFEAKEGKDVTVELDMLNVLFNYRMGAGYSFGMQTSVSNWSEIPVKTISLNKTAIEVFITKTEQLTTTLTPVNATFKELEWVSEDPTIATVVNGLVKGVKKGETVVVAYGDERRVEARCAVKVVQPVTDIQITPTTVNLEV